MHPTERVDRVGATSLSLCKTSSCRQQLDQFTTALMYLYLIPVVLSSLLKLSLHTAPSTACCISPLAAGAVDVARPHYFSALRRTNCFTVVTEVPVISHKRARTPPPLTTNCLLPARLSGRTQTSPAAAAVVVAATKRMEATTMAIVTAMNTTAWVPTPTRGACKKSHHTATAARLLKHR